MTKLLDGFYSCFATAPNMGGRGVGLSGSGSGPVEICCEYGSEPAGFIKQGDFFD
jgi:hypothetical protein